MARISFKIDGEIESFSDKATVKRIQYHKTSFTANVKQTYIVQKKKIEEKNLQNQPQTIKKMAIGTYISIITVNVNGLNSPTKTQTG